MPADGEDQGATVPTFPLGIDGVRHRDLTGRGGQDWGRRVIVGTLSVISVLGLLNVFGQCSRVTVASGAGATVAVDGPTRVRGGLVFTSEVVVTPERVLKDARIHLARGWFQGMSVNTIEPSPTTESSDGSWVIFGFGRLTPGHAFHLWLSLQTNPTNVGPHTQDVQVYDGTTPVAVAHRSVFVFP